MMERRVKERLIGAGILVALAVIVVPELLSGPKQESAEAARPDVPLELPQTAAAPGAVRNVTVDLNTSKPLASAPAAAPSAGQSPPTPTVTAAPTTPTGTPAGDPEAAEEAPDGASAPAPAATAPRIASAEAVTAPQRSVAGFAVQLGSFANRSNADNLVHQLKAQGFAVYTLNEGSGTAARYRVRVGPLNDRDAAERTIAKLKLAGHAATLVAPR